MLYNPIVVAFLSFVIQTFLSMKKVNVNSCFLIMEYDLKEIDGLRDYKTEEPPIYTWGQFEDSFYWQTLPVFLSEIIIIKIVQNGLLYTQPSKLKKKICVPQISLE